MVQFFVPAKRQPDLAEPFGLRCRRHDIRCDPELPAKKPANFENVLERIARLPTSDDLVDSGCESLVEEIFTFKIQM